MPSQAAATIADRVPSSGDRIRVTYTSVYGEDRNNQQITTGTVHSVDESVWAPEDDFNESEIDAALYVIDFEPDEEPDRDDYYLDDGAATRRLTVRQFAEDASPSATLKGRNGGRWHRISRGEVDWEVNFEDGDD